MFQELFYGPYFCQVQDAAYYDYTEEIPSGPTTQRFLSVARELGMVMVLPMYEKVREGLLLQHRGGRRRRRHLSRQVPQAAHPHVNGFWEKFYFRPGDGGYPVFDTAVGKVGVYICYDRHFPEGWRASVSNGAHLVFNPSATSRGLSNYLWKLEQPAPPSPTSTTSAPSTASASSRWATTTSTARATSSIRKASSSVTSVTPTSPNSSCAISTWISSRPCAIDGSSTAIVAPTPMAI